MHVKVTNKISCVTNEYTIILIITPAYPKNPQAIMQVLMDSKLLTEYIGAPYAVQIAKNEIRAMYISDRAAWLDLTRLENYFLHYGENEDSWTYARWPNDPT